MFATLLQATTPSVATIIFSVLLLIFFVFGIGLIMDLYSGSSHQGNKIDWLGLIVGVLEGIADALGEIDWDEVDFGD